MVLTKDKNIKRSTASKKTLFFTIFIGICLMITSITLFYVDPVLYGVQYKLRLENGSLVHELLQRRFTSTKIYLYLFNVTNEERFFSGADQKLKLEEIGPFVYQEYRTNEDLEINKDPGIMRYTPKFESIFIPEESIGDPKSINVTVPNISMLSAAALVSKYPFLVRQIFNMMVASSRSQAFVNLRVYDYFWGYKDELIRMATNVVPGLLYYKSVGLFKRFYDVEIDYRLELGTKKSDKFSVKKSTKIKSKYKSNATTPTDNEITYKDSYESVAFPPGLTAETPIHIYRHGLCRTFHLQYAASRPMSYGGRGFEYHFHNDTFMDRQQCDSQEWCPDGLKNMADCYFGFPIALSKGHFLDAEPRLLEMVEGLKPDRKRHDTHIVIDPKIGVGISGSMSLQLNLFLADTRYNPQTRRLADTVLPVMNMIVKSPPMIDEVRGVLRFLYIEGPYIILAVQVMCMLLASLLIVYSIKSIYGIWLIRRNQQEGIGVTPAQYPLLIS